MDLSADWSNSVSTLDGNPMPWILLGLTLAAILVALVAVTASVAALNRLRSMTPIVEVRHVRFNWGMLAAAAIVSVVAVAAIWLFTPTRYKASTVVQVESPSPRMPMQLTEPPISLELMERFLRDQAQLIQDEAVLREALTDSQVLSTDWYKQQPEKMALLQLLRDGLRADPIPHTSYLRVSFRAANPKDAANIVNTVIDKYLYQIQMMSQTHFQSELDDVRKREKALNDRVQAILDAKEKFIAQSLGAPGITEGINVVGETLRALTAEVTRLEHEKIEAKAEYENLRGCMRSGPTIRAATVSERSSAARFLTGAALKGLLTHPLTNTGSDNVTLSPQMKRMVQEDPEILRLKDHKLALELALRAAPTTAPADAASTKGLQAQIAFIEQQLSEMTTSKEKQLYDEVLNSALMVFMNKTAAELQLRERVLEMEARLRDLDQGMARFRNLEEQRQILADELKQVRAYSNQLELVIKDRGMVRVHRIGPATPPAAPDRELQSFLTLPALFGPLLLGLILGYVRPRYQS